jgi:hypothetical protein
MGAGEEATIAAARVRTGSGERLTGADIGYDFWEPEARKAKAIPGLGIEKVFAALVQENAKPDYSP